MGNKEIIVPCIIDPVAEPGIGVCEIGLKGVEKGGDTTHAGAIGVSQGVFRAECGGVDDGGGAVELLDFQLGGSDVAGEKNGDSVEDIFGGDEIEGEEHQTSVGGPASHGGHHPKEAESDPLVFSLEKFPGGEFPFSSQPFMAFKITVIAD